MADQIAKPKRTPTAKAPAITVPFVAAPDPAPCDKPVSEVIADIAHLPIEEPGRDAPVVATSGDAPSDAPATATPIRPETMTAAATAPTASEDETMTDTMQNTAETMQANAQDAMAKGRQNFDEMTAFGQGNVEAMVESGRVAVKGVEAMAQARAAFAKQSFEATVATLKSMTEVRTPADFFKLQGEYLRSSMDALVAETSRSTEATLKLVGEIAQPIQNRVALAAEKVRGVA